MERRTFYIISLPRIYRIEPFLGPLSVLPFVFGSVALFTSSGWLKGQFLSWSLRCALAAPCSFGYVESYEVPSSRNWLRWVRRVVRYCDSVDTMQSCTEPKRSQSSARSMVMARVLFGRRAVVFGVDCRFDPLSRFRGHLRRRKCVSCMLMRKHIARVSTVVVYRAVPSNPEISPAQPDGRICKPRASKIATRLLPDGYVSHVLFWKVRDTSYRLSRTIACAIANYEETKHVPEMTNRILGSQRIFPRSEVERGD